MLLVFWSSSIYRLYTAFAVSEKTLILSCLLSMLSILGIKSSGVSRCFFAFWINWRNMPVNLVLYMKIIRSIISSSGSLWIWTPFSISLYARRCSKSSLVACFKSATDNSIKAIWGLAFQKLRFFSISVL